MSALGRLSVSVSADIAQFTSAMSKMQHEAAKRFEGVKKSAKEAAKQMETATRVGAAAAAAGVGAFVAMQIAANNEAAKAAQAVGLSVSAYTELALAARQAGLEQDDLTEALNVLNEKATEGSPAFDALGISVKDASGATKNAQQMMKEAAAAFASFADGPEKSAMAMQLFGEDLGGRLIPMLNGGADALDKAAAQAQLFGTALSSDAADASEKLSGNVTTLMAAGQGLVNRFLEVAVPALVEFTGKLVDMLTAGGGFSALIAKVNSFAESFSIGMTAIGGTARTATETLRAFFERTYERVATIGRAIRLVAAGEFSAAADAVSGLNAKMDAMLAESSARLAAIAAETSAAIADRMGKELIRSGPAKIEAAVTQGIRMPIVAELEKTGEKAAAAGKSAAEKAAEQVASALASIRERIATFGMSSKELELFKLKGLGADGAQLSEAEAGLQRLAALEREAQDRQAQAEEAARRRAEVEAEVGRIIEANVTPVQQLEREMARLQELHESGALGADEYAKAWSRVKVQLDEAREAAWYQSSEMVRYADEAAQGTQQLFEEFLFDPFNASLREMGDSFVAMIRKMAAEAAAAQLMKGIGVTGGQVQKDGWLGGMLDAGMALFGMREFGGSVVAGKPYLVGERGPEVIVPGTAGHVIPNAALSGDGSGRAFSQTLNIQVSAPEGRISRASLQQLQASVAGATNRALARNG